MASYGPGRCLEAPIDTWPLALFAGAWQTTSSGGAALTAAISPRVDVAPLCLDVASMHTATGREGLDGGDEARGDGPACSDVWGFGERCLCCWWKCGVGGGKCRVEVGVVCGRRGMGLFVWDGVDGRDGVRIYCGYRVVCHEETKQTKWNANISPVLVNLHGVCDTRLAPSQWWFSISGAVGTKIGRREERAVELRNQSICFSDPFLLYERVGSLLVADRISCLPPYGNWFLVGVLVGSASVVRSLGCRGAVGEGSRTE